MSIHVVEVSTHVLLYKLHTDAVDTGNSQRAANMLRINLLSIPNKWLGLFVFHVSVLGKKKL